MKKVWKRGVCCECGRSAMHKLSHYCYECLEKEAIKSTKKE